MRQFKLNGVYRPWAALLTLCAVGAAAPAAHSGETAQGVGQREIWFGVDAGSHNWLAYSGATYAPWGDIHSDGFRLRSTAGYGQYDYHWNDRTVVHVVKSTADLMAGYQLRIGELTAKAFGGWALLSDLDVPAANSRVGKINMGFKGALELWLNLGPDGWTSLDLAYADTRQTWSARSRIGYRVLPTVSVGLEGVVNHTNLAGQVQIEPGIERSVGNGRVGAFARYEWFGGEVSASGGITGDLYDTLEEGGPLRRPSAYGTLNLILQF